MESYFEHYGSLQDQESDSAEVEERDAGCLKGAYEFNNDTGDTGFPYVDDLKYIPGCIGGYAGE